MNVNVITAIRNSKGFSRTVAYLVVLAIVGIALERIIYYTLVDTKVITAENPINTLYRVAPHKARQLGLPKPQRVAAKSNDTKLSETVVETQDTLDILAYELHRDGGDPAKAQSKLNELYGQLQQMDQIAMADFQKTGRHIEKHHLAEIIKERHRNAVSTYRKEMDTLLGNLKTALTTQDQKARFDAVMAARKHLEGKQLKRSQQPFDPNNLPNKSMQPNPNNKPKLTAEQFAEAGLYNNPLVQYASHGTYTFGNLAGASNPAYLAETDEVKITPAIQAKADELEHNPVQIYNWVRNNIEWIPSWGAMQDSDITLGSKRGNAMDISSLLIALYRASGIPARYVHGTIEVSEDKFRNWAGGFESIEAAANFASSGGIPTAAVVEGGRITSVRMEHVWVEAAIDYQPSRGAINKDADSWVPLDASYKLYEFSQGLVIPEITGTDAQLIADNFTGSGIINNAEGWVSGFDQSILKDNQAQVVTTLNNFINTNIPNATVGDVLGGKKIISSVISILPSSHPNTLRLVGARYSTIPSQLQAQLRLQLGTDEIGQPVGEVILPLARINNHKLILSFKPASSEDEAALLSFLPDSSVTEITQLPANLPGYFISFIPELKLDGGVIAHGRQLSLGQELNFAFNLRTPSKSFGNNVSPIQAGSYLVLAMTAQAVSGETIMDLENNISNIKSIIESGDSVQINAINWDKFYSDILFSGMLGYYAQLTSLANMAATRINTAQYLMPSGGTFGYVPKVDYFFGLPRSIQPGGIEVDLDSVNTITSALDGDPKKVFNMVQNFGVISSALEHEIPEMMFADSVEYGEGVSAVRLLAKANASGQKIFHISSANIAASLPQLSLNSEVIQDIMNAVALGHEVVTHTSNITISGYTGSGYIIIDPVTGAGAYKISGGLNGGGLFTAIGVLLNTISIYMNALETIAEKLGIGNLLKAKLQNVIRFIEVAKFAYSLLDKGKSCPDFGPIAIFLMLTTILSLIIVNFASIVNPVLGFALGLGMDWFFDWLFKQSNNAQECV